jgi:hypothetical protein
MKSLVFLICLASTSTSFAEQFCANKSIDCFDQEVQSWINFKNADTCEDYHDGIKWKTRAYCSSEGSSPLSCKGQTVDCFDAQTQKWITFFDANSCNDYNNGQSWVTEAICK